MINSAVSSVLVLSQASILGTQKHQMRGIASVVGKSQPAAWNGRFHDNLLEAAHKTLPRGTLVRVFRRCKDGTIKSVVVKITDRGPYINGRVIDLSTAAARKLGFTDGVKEVWLQVISIK